MTGYRHENQTSCSEEFFDDLLDRRAAPALDRSFVSELFALQPLSVSQLTHCVSDRMFSLQIVRRPLLAAAVTCIGYPLHKDVHKSIVAARNFTDA